MFDEKDPREMLRKQLIEKYGLDKRQELIDSQKPEGFDLKAFGAGVGSAIAGQGAKGADDVLAQREAQRKNQLDQFDKQRQGTVDEIGLVGNLNKAAREEKEQLVQDDVLKNKRDINSQESVFAQSLAAKMVPSQAEEIKKLNAEQIEARFPVLSKFFETDQARILKERELGAKQQEEMMKKMKEQEAIQKAAGSDPVRQAIFDVIPEGERPKAVQEYGQVKKAERIGSRINELLSSKGSDSSVFDKAQGQKLKTEVQKEIQAYLMNAQRTPQEAESAINTFERFFDSNPNATKQDIRSMALGIISNLGPETPTLDGYLSNRDDMNVGGIRPQFNVPKQSQARPNGQGQRSIVNKQYSASKNKTKITYSDGSTEVVDGQR